MIELALGSTVMAFVFAGMMGAFVQSRRLTEGSVFQNSAITVIQGYLEQIKNMDFSEIPYYSGSTLKRGSITTADNTIYTQLDSDTMDVLRISTGTPLSAATVTPGVVPSGVVDNLKLIDINDTPESTDDDLIMHLWIWIAPLDSAALGIGQARSIQIVYSWGFKNGGRTQTYVDSITTIRSVVPTF